VPDAPRLTLADVTADNWRDVADLAPRDDQRDFVPALAARYLLLGLYGGVWHCLGAFEGDTAVAHVMWAVDPDDGSHWIGGLLVDAQHQGRGVGRRVVELLIERLRSDPACDRICMSHPPPTGPAAPSSRHWASSRPVRWRTAR
jgi:diamine N-acetyltransferase